MSACQSASLLPLCVVDDAAIPFCAAGTFRFRKGHRPSPEEVHSFLVKRGLRIPLESLSISFDGAQFEIQCLILASSNARPGALSVIGDELSQLAHVEGFTLTHSSRA